MQIGKYGVYGSVAGEAVRKADTSVAVPVYIGTAPVNLATDGSVQNVNAPVVCASFEECVQKMGYSTDWAQHTLCEAMSAHFLVGEKPVGPIILINVMDPAIHTDGEEKTTAVQVQRGVASMVDAQDVIISSVQVSAGSEEKVLGVDYALSYSHKTQVLTIKEKASGALGETVTVKYTAVDPSAVVVADVVGSAEADNPTGVYAARQVYGMTGYVPSALLAPGWSGEVSVQKAMQEVRINLNGHWSVPMFTDIPLMDSEGITALSQADAWRQQNGYVNEGETVCFPMVTCVDGQNYHISTISALEKQRLEAAAGGIPYQTPANKAAPIMKGLYFGAESKVTNLDQDTISELLAKKGIRSACFWNGSWRLWGAMGAAYVETESNRDLSETSTWMLYHVCNWFQMQFGDLIDEPMTAGTAGSIVSSVNRYIAALQSAGTIIGGQCEMRADATMTGFAFTIEIVTSPLLKALEAVVVWSEEGVVEYLMGGK